MKDFQLEAFEGIRTLSADHQIYRNSSFFLGAVSRREQLKGHRSFLDRLIRRLVR
jgi:hypothetical protein